MFVLYTWIGREIFHSYFPRKHDHVCFSYAESQPTLFAPRFCVFEWVTESHHDLELSQNKEYKKAKSFIWMF